MKKVYIDTLGCPKNTNDSQVAAGILENNGYSMTASAEDADIVMVNTCGFINDAKRESIERIFELAQEKKEDAKLVVSGCLSKRYADDLFDEMPEVDCFIGVNEYEKIDKIFDELTTEGERKVFVNPCDEEVLKSYERKLNENPYTATIKIAEGCDNSCAYCIIPKIRGHFRSKKKEDIIKEAQGLAAKGCKELILIAQDVTCYGIDLYGKYALAELLRELCKVDGIEWIRLMYCYEDRITDELIETIAKEDKICKYIDIPIQHASDNVLSAMNRRSTRKSIHETLEKLKKRIPDIHIRTTLIVGFPGETEEDFDELLDFVEKERFARLGVFAYSMEEDTVAGEMENQIDEEIKAERLDAIMRRQLDISLEHNKEMIGKTLPVIIDEIEEPGSYIGRTMYDAPEIDNSVIFVSENGAHEVGDMVCVEIMDAFDYDLTGKEV